MKYARIAALAVLSGTVMTGCLDDSTNTGPVRDVEWFKAHEEERMAVLEKCMKNPGKLQGTPNCVNAEAAAVQLTGGSLRNFDW